MKEHTITKMRTMLSSEDSDMLSALKEKERNKNRNLTERMSKDKLAALLNAGGNPKKIFSKRYWQDVAQLVVHGEIDPKNMKPLFAPKSASALERLGVISPHVAKPLIKGLRGLKRFKDALGDVTKERPNYDIFNKDHKFDKCARKHRIGTHAYYVCTDQTKGKAGHDDSDDYGGGGGVNLDAALRQQRRMERAGLRTGRGGQLTAQVPTHTRERRSIPMLTRELEAKILEFGNIKKLAQAISKLKR